MAEPAKGTNNEVVVPVEEAPVVSTSTFLAITGGVFSVGLLWGIRRAYKQDSTESSISEKLLSKDAKAKLALEKAANGAIPGKSTPASLFRSFSPLAALSKNQPGVVLAFRAFVIGSALCWSSFIVGSGLFMYVNDLKSTEDLQRFLRSRMQNSRLGKLVKAKDTNPAETAEIEQWFEELFTNPWKALETPAAASSASKTPLPPLTTDASSTPTPSTTSEEAAAAAAEAASAGSRPENGGIAAIIAYKWDRLIFKVGLGPDPGPPPRRLSDPNDPQP
eukprot:gene15068-10779_t